MAQVSQDSIREARSRVEAAGRILERAEAGTWTVGDGTIDGIEKLCQAAVKHLRGTA